MWRIGDMEVIINMYICTTCKKKVGVVYKEDKIYNCEKCTYKPGMVRKHNSEDTKKPVRGDGTRQPSTRILRLQGKRNSARDSGRDKGRIRR